MPTRTTRWAACSPSENPAVVWAAANECSDRSKTRPKAIVAAPALVRPGIRRAGARAGWGLVATVPLVVSIANADYH